MTNKEILTNALNNIKQNKQSAIQTRQNAILTSEVNPKIAENRKKFDEAWAAAKAELEQKNQELTAEGRARAEAEVEAEYAVMIDGIEKLIGE